MGHEFRGHQIGVGHLAAAIAGLPAFYLCLRASRAIIRHEGPERIAMDWWRHEEAQSCRDYFRIEDEEGRRYWLYRSRADAQWFLHGLFS